MTDNYQRFLEFYGNNKVSTCHGKSGAGESYVCPHPTIGGLYSGQKPLVPEPASASGCGVGNNIGRWALCPTSQRGGCGGMSYGADGVLINKKSCSRGQAGGGASGSPGYFADLPSGSIAGRPIYAEGNSNKIPNLLLAKPEPSFMSRAFNCLQPLWGGSCV